MSRTIPNDHWAMLCDYCWEWRSELRPQQSDLPFIEFASKGWQIGRNSDKCPDCINQTGPFEDALIHEQLMSELETCQAYSQEHFGRDIQSPALDLLSKDPTHA